MFIDGGLRIFYIKWEDEFLPVGCLTSDSFNESSEMLDTTTRDNEGWKTSTPTNQSYIISFDGLITNTRFVGGDADLISLDRLISLKRSRTLIEWKTDDNTFVNFGKGYITSLSDSASIDEFITFNASIEGYGVPVIAGKYEIENSLQTELQYEL